MDRWFNLSMRIIKEDIDHANYGIEKYKRERYRESKSIACFHIQQAVEKMIKIQFQNRVSQLNWSNLRTHDINRLRAYAEQLRFKLYIPNKIIKNVDHINAWETSGRYFDDFSVRIDFIENIYKEVVTWYADLWKSGYR